MSKFGNLGRCRRTAELIINDGIKNWERPAKGPSRREEHTTLLECRENVRDAYRSGELPDKDLCDELTLVIDKARLVLGAADYADQGASGVIAAQYPDSVLEKLLELDGYRQYSVYDADSETLQRRIASQDGKLYDLIREEVAPQLNALNEALTGTHSELDEAQMAAVEELTKERLDRLQEAVGLYMRYNGLPNVTDEMEDAVLDAAEAANQRATITDELAAVVEDSLDELSQSLHGSIRDERRELTDELHRLTFDSGSEVDSQRIDTLLERVNTLLERQQEHHESLRDQIETHREKLSSLESTIDELETTISEGDVDDKYEQLLADQLDQLREQKADIEAQVAELRAERAELEATREELQADQSALERGEVPDREGETTETVYATEARIAEFDYSSRFETAVHESPEIALPGGDTFTADSSYWRNHHSRTDDRRTMRQLLSEHREDLDEVDAVLGRHPLGRRSRFVVGESGRLSLSTRRRLVLELRVHPHLETFARYGGDDRPATQSDLLEVVNDVVRRAEGEDTPHLLAVASPTGWTDAVETAVARGNAVSFSRQVGLVLVDLQDRSVVYDETERLLDANAALFSFQTRSEVTSNCVETIRETYVGVVDYVSVDTVVAETEFEEYTVTRAFARLEEEGVGTRRQRADDLYLDLRNKK